MIYWPVGLLTALQIQKSAGVDTSSVCFSYQTGQKIATKFSNDLFVWVYAVFISS
jgi:hypothetical protein